MSAPTTDVLRWGAERARTGRWRGDGAVAFLNPLPDAPLPSEAFLRRCLATLSERGFSRVVTGALSPPEQRCFLAAGFAVEQRLHLLSIELGSDLAPLPDGIPLYRATRHHRPQVLQVDGAAFSPFWRFDEAGLRDALAATPHTRFRVACDPEGVVAGYAVCGRAGNRGFVQRLAVDPELHGRGIGRRLLLDGLHWMRRRRVERAIVNTQVGNDVALSLYLRTGFREDPSGLSVLSAGLG
jgi:ribosomal protein S18 acetylase RimI-like enzyme